MPDRSTPRWRVRQPRQLRPPGIAATRATGLSVSNSLSGRHWELDQVPAVGDLTDIVQLDTGHHVSVGEGQRRVALQRRVAAYLVGGGQTPGATQRCLNPGFSERIENSRRTGGTATLDTDYTLSSTTITLAEGETAGTVTITVTDDAEDDAGETIVIDAESTSPALTAEPLTLTIEDNDVTPVPALPLRGVLWLGLLLTLLGAVRMRMRERTDIARGC